MERSMIVDFLQLNEWLYGPVKPVTKLYESYKTGVRLGPFRRDANE